MASTSEVGHAKNAANLGLLITFLNSNTATYKPQNPDIAITALQTLKTNIDAAIKLVDDKRGPLANAINARQDAYAKLDPLVTSVYGSVSSMKGTSAIAKDLNTFKNKIVGYDKSQSKKSKTKTPTSPATTSAGGSSSNSEVPDDKSYSKSQQSYDMKLANFKSFVSMVKTVAGYNPNEAFLKAAALDATIANLETLNAAVNTNYMPYKTAIGTRDELMYGAAETSMIKLVKAVKKYGVGAFGIKSAAYKQLNGIAFKNLGPSR